MAAYNARISQMVAEADARRKADEAVDAIVESLGVPNYRYMDKWGKFLFQFILDFNDYRTIEFPDIDEIGCIGRNSDKDRYMAKSSEYWYINELDAIIAEYAYLKYGKIRKKGRY